MSRSEILNQIDIWAMVMRVAAQWVLVIAVALAYASAESFGEGLGYHPTLPLYARVLPF